MKMFVVDYRTLKAKNGHACNYLQMLRETPPVKVKCCAPLEKDREGEARGEKQPHPLGFSVTVCFPPSAAPGKFSLTRTLTASHIHLIKATLATCSAHPIQCRAARNSPQSHIFVSYEQRY